MKKILVPTDFSREPNVALDLAFSLAKKAKAEIELLHTEESIHQEAFTSTGEHFNDSMDQVFMVKLLQKVKRNLKVTANNVKYKGVKINQHLEFGRPAENILKYIKEKKVDFVVMGSKGMTKSKGLFVGSNAQKVARVAEVPVLVLHSKDVPKDIKKIVFCTTGEVKGKTIEGLKAVQKVSNATIELVKIITPNHFVSTHLAESQLQKIINGFKLKQTQVHVYADASIEAGVLNFASKHGCDIIAMEHSHRTLLEAFFDPSISMEVAKKTKLPVLLFGI